MFFRAEGNDNFIVNPGRTGRAVGTVQQLEKEMTELKRLVRRQGDELVRFQDRLNWTEGRLADGALAGRRGAQARHETGHERIWEAIQLNTAKHESLQERVEFLSGKVASKQHQLKAELDEMRFARQGCERITTTLEVARLSDLVTQQEGLIGKLEEHVTNVYVDFELHKRSVEGCIDYMARDQNDFEKQISEVSEMLQDVKSAGEEREHRIAQDLEELRHAAKLEVEHRTSWEEKHNFLSEGMEDLVQQLERVSNEIEEKCTLNEEWKSNITQEMVDLRNDQNDQAQQAELMQEKVQSVEVVLFKISETIREDITKLRDTLNVQDQKNHTFQEQVEGLERVILKRDGALQDQLKGLQTVLFKRGQLVLKDIAALRETVIVQGRHNDALQERLLSSEERCRQLVEDRIHGVAQHLGAQHAQALQELHDELLQELPQQEQVDHVSNRLDVVWAAMGMGASAVPVDLPAPELDHPERASSARSSDRSEEASQSSIELWQETLTEIEGFLRGEASGGSVQAASSPGDSSEDAGVPSAGSNVVVRTHSSRGSDSDQAHEAE